MTALPALPANPPSGRWARLRLSTGRLAAGAANVVRAGVAPAASHILDHAYTILGLGAFCAAGYVHSVFTGLILTGCAFLVFEWKVSELCRAGRRWS